MATIYIDNQPHQVPDGKNLLEACLALGFDIPYFCWHPALNSVGACRQCAVRLFKDEHDTQGRIVMSCMTPAAEGTRIVIDDPEVRAFRRSVIELLMLNHPHDCPVCDEGGECHLQDMTVMTGQDYRRTRFPKRTHVNQDLGPLVTHEMNRCIQCYRCVRFYRDYAGGRDLDVFGWHDHVYFGRQSDGRLESEFAGNLVEVCPTGVFTDKSLYGHYTRKWDLQTAPSVCVHCGLGCNTLPGERYGTLRRIRSRFNAQVNGFFLCDRGRYGYEFVNGPDRLREVVVGATRNPGATPKRSALGGASTGQTFDTGEDTPKQTALGGGTHELGGGTLDDILESVRSGRAVGIGSPRASLESNFALRQLVGAERFFAGIAPSEHARLRQIVRILRTGPAAAASLKQVELAQGVLVLGENPASVAPMLALAVRQAAWQRPAEQACAKFKLWRWDDAAVRQAAGSQRGPVYVATPEPTALDELAAATFRAGPDDLARLAAAVAHEIDPAAPAAVGLDEDTRAMARRIAQDLLAVDRVVVICGASLGSEALIDAAARVAGALKARGKDARIAPVVSECNSLGLTLMEPLALDGVLPALTAGLADTLIVVENDLVARLGDPQAQAVLAAAKHVVAIDCLRTPTVDRAEVVLPACTFAESAGTFVNNEGRAQRFFQVLAPRAPVMESWRWCVEIAARAAQSSIVNRQSSIPPLPSGRGSLEARSLVGWKNLDDVLSAMAAALPALAGAAQAAPPASFRLHDQPVPRQPHRYSGRTAMFADRTVHEPAPPHDPDGPMSFSMEGYPGLGPPELIAHYWAPAWNSVQAVNKFQNELGPGLADYVSGVRLIEPSTGPGGAP